MNKKAPAGNRPQIEGCPFSAAFAAVGGKWKLTILYWLAHGELHFAGLERRVTPISHKVLAEQLRELEADGIVSRTPTGAVPAPVIYELTPYGKTLLPIIESVRIWGEGHLERWAAVPRTDGMACGNSVIAPQPTPSHQLRQEGASDTTDRSLPATPPRLRPRTA